MRDAERDDACVEEGEVDVARRNVAHGLVEWIGDFIGVAIGRPEIAAGDFVAVSSQRCLYHAGPARDSLDAPWNEYCQPNRFRLR